MLEAQINKDTTHKTTHFVSPSSRTGLNINHTRARVLPEATDMFGK